MFWNKKKMLLMFVFVLSLVTEQAMADYFFSTPENLGPIVNSADSDGECDISSDGLELYFGSERPGGSGRKDLWVTTKATTDDEWGEPVNLGSTVNSSQHDWAPSISTDSLSLYFSSGRSGSRGFSDIWVTTRPSISDSWGRPVNLGTTVNSDFYDTCPSLSADGLSLFFGSNREKITTAYPDLCYIYVTTRPTTNDPWGTPARLGSAVNPGLEYDSDWPRISDDGLSLFFSRWFPDIDKTVLYVATRTSTLDSWSNAVSLGLYGICPWISADGSIMYLSSSEYGGHGTNDLFQIPIEPVVDFTGDGIVDAADMCVVVDYWNKNYSLCDIGPTPFGDDIVDTQDLIVLSEYFFEEVNDLTLVAHWALDETEGYFAYDSAGSNNAIALGEPVWQPEGGMVDGAILFDGVDDYVITNPIPDLTTGSFSAICWINGGAPGQVVLSQTVVANWLCTDLSDGTLMTELKSTDMDSSSLDSETIITDGDWHRIGVTWDGLHRRLYVDGAMVAEDTQDDLEGSENGLYIGAGKMMQTETYWSGLIDDIRIYNRVVHP